MKNNQNTSLQLIADAYESYHRSVFLYICRRVNNKEEAEDLTHDVFLNLMDYKQMLRPDTVKFFIYTISRNKVNDYLRRYYKRMEMTSYMYDNAPVSSNETESRVIADDLRELEERKLETLSTQRKKVYVLNRFEGKTTAEISTELSLAPRTVENHLHASRKEIRNYIRQCI